MTNAIKEVLVTADTSRNKPRIRANGQNLTFTFHGPAPATTPLTVHCLHMLNYSSWKLKFVCHIHVYPLVVLVKSTYKNKGSNDSVDRTALWKALKGRGVSQ